jgi:sugar lactone lactonase YvrE
MLTELVGLMAYAVFKDNNNEWTNSQMKKLFVALTLLLLGAVVYLLAWPVAVEPQAWSPAENPGYAGPFAANSDLAGLEFIDLPAGEYGPEDIAVGADGQLYTATHSGKILRIDPLSGRSSVLADTGGRPLGIEFDGAGTLWIADAYRGLMALTASGEMQLLASETSDGSPILYADDLDIAPDGRVYFSDASMRFGAEDNGGTLAASLLDLMEHSTSGRVLVYDPQTRRTDVFADGLSFANGVAVSANGAYLFVNETGTYQVHRYSLAPASYGTRETVISSLPGFPDNINRMPDGSLWLGIVSPRAPALDTLAQKPFLRKLVARLPASMGPAPQRYGFVIRMDESGKVVRTLQDPGGAYASTTGAIRLPDGRLAITSLTEPRIGIYSP